MSKIESLDELEDGDVVYLFGSPFLIVAVQRGNPFVYQKDTNWAIFDSVADNTNRQYAKNVYVTTRIYKAKEFTVEDKAELILEGYGDCLNE